MPGDIVLALSGVFVTVAVVSASATFWWLARNAPEQRRLRTLVPTPAPTGVVVDRPAVLADGADPQLARLRRYLPKSAQEMSRLRKRLARAGYPHPTALAIYSLAELLLPVLLAGTVLLLLGVSTGWTLALLAAALGYILPGFYLGRLTTQRMKTIRNGLPDALDLITVCVEAGSGLDQAIQKASDELHLAHPALTHELRTITSEVRAGKPRLEAFRNFAERTDIEDVRSLVAVLTQTDRFGTSIAQALRTHAETSRTKRRQSAEERAGKVGVKLVFPLALCLFPALYIVCFGPVVVRIYHSFFLGQ